MANKKFCLMKQNRINLSFEKYSDADFENKVTYIIECMTGNANFGTPVPPLADVQAALDKFSDALTAAAGLDRVAVAEKNKCREDLVQLVVQLGNYVIYIANGNTAILASSGYTPSKQREPRNITNPGNVTLSNGVTSGELVAKVKRVSGASAYFYQITGEEPTENTQWVSTSGTRSQFTFTDLVPGKRYWVRMAAIGRDQQVAYSPVATQFVQ